MISLVFLVFFYCFYCNQSLSIAENSTIVDLFFNTLIMKARVLINDRVPLQKTIAHFFFEKKNRLFFFFLIYSSLNITTDCLKVDNEIIVLNAVVLPYWLLKKTGLVVLVSFLRIKEPFLCPNEINATWKRVSLCLSKKFNTN